MKHTFKIDGKEYTFSHGFNASAEIQQIAEEKGRVDPRDIAKICLKEKDGSEIEDVGAVIDRQDEIANADYEKKTKGMTDKQIEAYVPPVNLNLLMNRAIGQETARFFLLKSLHKKE